MGGTFQMSRKKLFLASFSLLLGLHFVAWAASEVYRFRVVSSIPLPWLEVGARLLGVHQMESIPEVGKYVGLAGGSAVALLLAAFLALGRGGPRRKAEPRE